MSQNTATHCNALQHTATYCNTPYEHSAERRISLHHSQQIKQAPDTCLRTLQHTATHCNALQHTVWILSRAENLVAPLSTNHASTSHVGRTRTLSLSQTNYSWKGTHHNTLQHTATRCNTLQNWSRWTNPNSILVTNKLFMKRHTNCSTAKQNKALQHTTTYCNTLQHTIIYRDTLQRTATHCNTLQRTATHCNTLQHSAARCNTLQHAATRCNTLST